MSSAATMFKIISAAAILVASASARPEARWLAETNSTDAEWTYRRTHIDGVEPYGPEDWYLGYPDCAGTSQSPINIAADIESFATMFALELNRNVCESDELFFKSDERVWEVIFTGCAETPTVTFEGDIYNLLQIHIHSPSEHMIGGSLHDAEIHFVHARNGTDDELLVIGVMLDANEYGSNEEIAHLWEVLEIGVESTTMTTETKVYDLLPGNPVYSHYMGSLTTPPCTEGVKWIVMNTPVVIGMDQLEEFRVSVATYEYSKVDEMSNTNRECQPLNGRSVYFV